MRDRRRTPAGGVQAETPSKIVLPGNNRISGGVMLNCGTATSLN